jgi:hypothetical protein
MKRLGNYFSINFRASAEKYGSVLNLENWISTWPNFADVMPTVDISKKNEHQSFEHFIEAKSYLLH